MAARAISSGTIAFGLVSIPVKLFPSVSPNDGIHFNTLHRDCGTRIKQQFWCPKDERAVGRDEVIKGYEFGKGQFVTFTNEELKAVEEHSTGAIDIQEFVPIEKIDPIFYAKAYYLGPDTGSPRAYHLLAEALRRAGLCGVAKYAARGKQYLVILRPVKEGLVMQQLHYPSEVRPIADVGIEGAEVNEGELGLAMQLIGQSTVKTFRPDQYSDEVRGRVEAMIQKKIEGEDITQAESESPKTQVIDLMAALKQSLGLAPAPSGGTEAPPAEEHKAPKRAASKARGKAKASGDDE